MKILCWLLEIPIGTYICHLQIIILLHRLSVGNFSSLKWSGFIERNLDSQSNAA